MILRSVSSAKAINSGRGCTAHFFQNPAAMELDCGWSRAVHVGNFLVAIALDHPSADFALLVGQAHEAITHVQGEDFLALLVFVFLQGQVDGLQQGFEAKRFDQKIDRAFFHGFDDFGGLALARDENDGGFSASGNHLVLQRESVHAGHANVQQNDGRCDRQSVAQKSRWAVKGLDGIADRTEAVSQASADGWVVINQVDMAFEIVKIHGLPEDDFFFETADSVYFGKFYLDLPIFLMNTYSKSTVYFEGHGHGGL